MLPSVQNQRSLANGPRSLSFICSIQDRYVSCPDCADAAAAIARNKTAVARDPEFFFMSSLCGSFEGTGYSRLFIYAAQNLPTCAVIDAVPDIFRGYIGARSARPAEKDMLHRIGHAIIAVVFLLQFSACGAGGDDESSSPTQTAADDTENATPVTASEPDTPGLAGTRWQLVKIMSMNDTESVPDDRSQYTLAFGHDGAVTILADCNRGKGTYSSASPGQLTFGPIASTRMACPPGSLHDTYLAQFEWVRSYVLENGHLFIATMADGAIIEFEPMPDQSE